ncbi:MAG TPA: PQQ-binding-like beta-propeller repeat protein [Gemmatimonadaceae bacterium]
MTEVARTFGELNARLAGAAPAVAWSITGDRLVHARGEPQNWLTYYGTYDGQRHSALDQITTANVEQLRPAWIFQAGVIGLIANPPTYSLEATPIVVDGVMYLSGWDGYVWALDAATGRMLWQYKHAIPLDGPLCCGNVNRGVAVAQGKVYVATANGYLVALDAATGKPTWTVAFADVRSGESATGAPLVVKDMVIVGSSGGEYGVRGHIDAFDLATGRRRWRRYNTPRPGEPGAESWSGDSWARGGGAAWVTGTYDPELDLVFWGTETGLLYTPVVELCGRFSRRHTEFRESLPHWGGEVSNHGLESWGYVRALEPATGRVARSYRTKHPMVGSLLTTAGGLVFAGEPTGEFDALDARTGRLLWQFQTGNGIHGSPIAYSVNGKEYVAVPSGWGGWMKGFAPELYGAPRRSALIVFALP